MNNDNTERKIWEQQVEWRESDKAYAAFCPYRDAGAERSLESVARQLHKSKQLLGRWSMKFRWVERAQAYDRDQERMLADAKQKALGDEAAKWAERALALREREWTTAQELLKKADDMLKFPLMERELKRDTRIGAGGEIIEEVTIIHPAKWGFRDAAALFDLAARLQRNAVGVESTTVKTKVEGTGKDGAILVEDVEARRRQRWQDALPALAELVTQAIGQDDAVDDDTSPPSETASEFVTNNPSPDGGNHESSDESAAASLQETDTGRADENSPEPVAEIAAASNDVGASNLDAAQDAPQIDALPDENASNENELPEALAQDAPNDAVLPDTALDETGERRARSGGAYVV